MARLIKGLIALLPLCAFAQQPPWQGTYFGVNLGAANIAVNPQLSTVYENPGYFRPSSVPVINEAGNQTTEDWSFTAGGQIGYNWQWLWFVFGLEADGSYIHGSESNSVTTLEYPCCSPKTFTLETNAKTEWQSTVRPRLGYAFDNGPMFYITGGLAVAGLSADYSFKDDTVESSDSLNDINIGWAAGGGFEVLMSKNALFRAEYIFTEYTTDQITNEVSVIDPNTHQEVSNPLYFDANYKVHMLRLGLNLKM
jgi:outer membrane immunogenic protein